MATLWLGLVTGCAASSTRANPRSNQVGAYRFTQRVAEDLELEGILVIEADTLSIEATPGPCRYDQMRSNVLTVSYTCADVYYTFDRTDPLLTARYSAVAHLRDSRVTCARYTVTSTGQQVCAETRTETVYRDVRRSGLLQPRRMSDNDPARP